MYPDGGRRSIGTPKRALVGPKMCPDMGRRSIGTPRMNPHERREPQNVSWCGEEKHWDPQNESSCEEGTLKCTLMWGGGARGPQNVPWCGGGGA